MRILRFSSPNVDDGLPTGRAITLVGDRVVAVAHGRELRLYGLRSPDAPLLGVPSVVEYALGPTRLVVLNTDAELRRFDERDGRWQKAGTLRVPAVSGAVSPYWRDMKLSASGRYLLVESDAIPTGRRTWAVSRSLLIDADTGEVKREFNLGKTAVRASFAVLPSSEEALFISADNYMSVQLVDCASGRPLNEYVARGPWDFCHTGYQLSADGTRLFAVGCYWSAPFEARVYDATPWTGEGRSASDFPLPLLFRQEEEALEWDRLLFPWPSNPRDDVVVCAVLVDIENLPAPNTPRDTAIRNEIDGADRAIYEALRRLPRHGSAVVIRRVDRRNGTLVAWSVHPVAKTEWDRGQVLEDGRVLTLGERIQVADGLKNEVIDYGPFAAPGRWFATAATTDGGTLVVCAGTGTEEAEPPATAVEREGSRVDARPDRSTSPDTWSGEK